MALLAAGCSEPESAPTQPNIILVLADDLDLATARQLPTLGPLLADRGVSFENAFADYPVCCPSRASILTGLYTHNHGVRDNTLPLGGFEKFREEGNEEKTIAVHLQESGYKTVLLGKYLNEYPADDPTYVPPGWDEWYATTADSTTYYGYDLNKNGTLVSYGENQEDYLTDVLSGKATEYIHRAASGPEPFFMYLAPVAPHPPATPAERHRRTLTGETAPRPPSFDEENVSDKPSWVRNIDRLTPENASRIDNRYRKRLESMLAVEEMIDALIQKLEAVDVLDNTYLFFASDNGWLGGEHRIPIGKVYPYEESIRIPLFVRGPGISPGSETREMVLNTDLAPTFADLAGDGTFPADGRSLMPLLRGEDPAWRSSILLTAFQPGYGGPPAYKAVRTRTHKYVRYITGESELYDLETDPHELESIHETADPSVVADLKAKLDALRTCAGQSCREAEDIP